LLDVDVEILASEMLRPVAERINGLVRVLEASGVQSLRTKRVP
jgi:hypothetical protein